MYLKLLPNYFNASVKQTHKAPIHCLRLAAQLYSKQLYCCFAAALIITPNVCLSHSEEEKMTKQWFNTKECAVLEIKKYKSISVRQVVSAVTINDSKVVKNIMQRIENIPVDGDKMKSFGPDAESIDLFFHCDNKTIQTVEIYQKKFKTPSTGFNSGTNEVELLLYSDIDALLLPDLNKRILKIKNVALKFKDFSLTYLGSVASEKTLATVSWTLDKFLIKDNSDREQIIEISSGQLPPAPYDFDIGKAGFTLLTHQAGMTHRLYPDYFQVVRR